MKYCEDCKFYRVRLSDRIFRNVEFARCAAAVPTGEAMVSRRLVNEMGFCSIERGYDSLCGPDAKHFKPKAAPLPGAGGDQ